MNPLQKLTVALILFYRRRISPAKPACCRFYPTCSTYALEAVQLHGFFKGGALAIWRILRCNPWNPGGVDPVPGSALDQAWQATSADELLGFDSHRDKTGRAAEKEPFS